MTRISSTLKLQATRTELSRSRRAVLSYLVKLNKAIEARHHDLAQTLCGRFSETLIDYISYGHFRLFQEFSAEAHHAAALENITSLALTFDEKHRRPEQVSLAALKADLEQIALALEVRFEIEDEVVCLPVT